jgi:SnoaL-like domain
VDSLRRAAEAHDCEAVIALFADDIIIRSPITTLIRFEGIDQARDLFRRVFDIIEDIRFYEMVGDGQTQVIFWQGRIKPHHYLEEANLLRINKDGKISEMTVFMRAVPGLLALAEQLASSFAGRKGRARQFIVRLLLGFVGVLYRRNEALVVKLTQAGEPVDQKTLR